MNAGQKPAGAVVAPGCNTAASCWQSPALGAFSLCPERRESSCQNSKCYPKLLPSFSVHVSLRIEFGASFHALSLLKGNEERHHPRTWICRALILCWVWKGLRAEAEFPECIVGEMQCFFSWLCSCLVKHKACM